MIVTIMYRNSYVGGDGWVYFPKTIEIGDNCPVCGTKRGEPVPKTYCEDGEWHTVDNWTNPCGHLDKYEACYLESQKLKNEKSTKDIH